MGHPTNRRLAHPAKTIQAARDWIKRDTGGACFSDPQHAHEDCAVEGGFQIAVMSLDGRPSHDHIESSTVERMLWDDK
jgi:hypothetical protein